MMRPRLTTSGLAAKTPAMNETGQGAAVRSGAARYAGAAIVMGLMAALSGCISVKAPDKPIVIELNINIKQEVIYRLAADAGNTIENNPEIF